jgi:multicomponent Na+:H+ antiporter subunit E
MKRLIFVLHLLEFVLFYAREVLLSNLRVAYDAITPDHHARPGIVAIPLRAESDLEILLLANLISMTPGTLSLDVSTDRTTLYVHAMFLDDPEATRREIIEKMEGRVLRLLRG